MHQIKRLLLQGAFILSAAVIVSSAVLPAASADAEELSEAIPSYMHLPVTEENADASSGLKTTWSCVSFGSYPFAEVVDGGWDSVDGYALRDGDVIRDDDLYSRLEQADWEENTAVLDGQTYLREKAGSADAAAESREQHYRFSDPGEWHYFAVLPISWRILDIQDGKALLLADRMPDSMPFHTADEDVTWRESTLRSWLNGYDASGNLQGISYEGAGFLDLAFTADERDAILPVQCDNKANHDYGTDSGPDTEDYLFILSNEEVFEGDVAGRYGFEPSRNYDDPAKRFTSTLYAKFRGAWWSPVAAYAGNSFWFMRTSGYTPRSVTYICDFGFVYSKGTLVTCSDAGVLPAMWVDLDKALAAGMTDAGETESTDIMHSSGDMASSGLNIADPVIKEDDAMPGGKYTEWDAVAFGHYPQTEILEKEPVENGNGGQSGLEQGGQEQSGQERVIDPELYRMLEEKAGSAADEITLEDTAYVRENGRWFRCDPIIWRVLDVSDGSALLLSDRILDSVPYNDEYRDVCWEESGLRRWLNGFEPEDLTDAGRACYKNQSFLDRAFTEEELRAVIVSSVSNDNNYYFETVCGPGTHDRVFILGEEEVFSSEKAEAYGFRPDDAVADPGRRILPTAYAAGSGAWRSEAPETMGIGFWLLRTNGYTQDNVVYVGEKGYLYNRGIPVTCMDAGIVPAIRVRVNDAYLVQAEDISSRLMTD